MPGATFEADAYKNHLKGKEIDAHGSKWLFCVVFSMVSASMLICASFVRTMAASVASIVYVMQ